MRAQIEQLCGRGVGDFRTDLARQPIPGCSVAVNDTLGGQLAGTHLAERGHCRVAFGGGPASIRQVAERHDGAAKALAHRGAELTLFETDATSVADGRRAAELIAEVPASRRPTAVFCANDLIALGMLQEMTRRGVRVPQDLAIVGYDDIDFASAAAVPLTSIRQPREQLGRSAAKLLLDEVASGERHRHRHVVFEPELVVRASSDYRRRSRAGTVGV